MDIKELNKTQLILLTLLITFVVSIATGIVTVSLMQQMPKSVPQTINNVIQRTIEKVSVPMPVITEPSGDTKPNSSFGDGDALVPIYSLVDASIPPETSKPLGQGIIISDVGLLLADASILTDKDIYKVVLGGTTFDATIIKKFTNGFAILKISTKDSTKKETPPTPEPVEKTTPTVPPTL
jgi:hypothetical protein